jgi:putative transposase
MVAGCGQAYRVPVHRGRVGVAGGGVGAACRAARFGFNQCLALVKDALDQRSRGRVVVVPWSGFDLINAFNAWKRSAAAGRMFVVNATGSTQVTVTGLAWRHEVSQQVFEEAAVDLGRALTAFSAARHGKRRRRRVGFCEVQA